MRWKERVMEGYDDGGREGEMRWRLAAVGMETISSTGGGETNACSLALLLSVAE